MDCIAKPKVERDGYSDSKDNSRRWKMSDLQINMGKEFYNANVQILLKKIQYTYNIQ